MSVRRFVVVGDVATDVQVQVRGSVQWSDGRRCVAAPPAVPGGGAGSPAFSGAAVVDVTGAGLAASRPDFPAARVSARRPRGPPP